MSGDLLSRSRTKRRHEANLRGLFPTGVKGRWVELRVLDDRPPLPEAGDRCWTPGSNSHRQLRSFACGPRAVPSPCPIHPVPGQKQTGRQSGAGRPKAGLKEAASVQLRLLMAG